VVSALAAAAAAVSASCGGGIDCSKVMLTVDGNAQTALLTDAQLANICDVQACMFGGYNARVFCATGPAVSVSSGRQQCVANTARIPECSSTVDQLLQCTQAVAQNPCQSTFFMSDACAPLASSPCVTFRTGALTMTAAEASQAP
jgi:hypothetical protein